MGEMVAVKICIYSCAYEDLLLLITFRERKKKHLFTFLMSAKMISTVKRAKSLPSL